MPGWVFLRGILKLTCTFGYVVVRIVAGSCYYSMIGAYVLWMGWKVLWMGWKVSNRAQIFEYSVTQ